MNRKITQAAEALNAQPPAPPEPLLVPVAEAARLTGGSVRQAYRKIAAGDLVAVKDGAATRITMESIRRHVAALPRVHCRPSTTARAA